MKKALPLIAPLLLAVVVNALAGNAEQRRKIAEYEETLKGMAPEKGKRIIKTR